MFKKLSVLMLASGLVLSACSNESRNKEELKNEGHKEHKHESEIPENMKNTNDSKFNNGDKITITEGHMPGMKNAKGTVKRAYKTYAYVVSYEPTNNDKKVNNHKWIVNEEIANAHKNGYKQGDTVKLNANHMPGMKGATAKIDDVKKTTVYVVDYQSTENNKIVKNHKWMSENELKSR
ncbi:YdhK family protein [Staphylococcus xylosus]|uniref:YdhK family protein n=1 Tax=Staphylococcus xylosus TaxID=1288 RepID=UPI0033651044